MIKKLLCLIALTGFFTSELYSEDGKTLFKTNCTACHSIGKGRLVGPDLKNVVKKRKEEWLHKWIKSSSSMIKAGDAEAVALFQEFNQVPMTEFSFLSDDQIKSILTYINEESSSAATSVAELPQSSPSGISGNSTSYDFLTTENLLMISFSALLVIVIFLLSGIIRKQSNQLRLLLEEARGSQSPLEKNKQTGS